MRRALETTAWLGLLVLVSAGCGDAGGHVERLRDSAADAQDGLEQDGLEQDDEYTEADPTDADPVDGTHAGDAGGASTGDGAAPPDQGLDAFCLALTRTAAALASGSPATAEEAAEESLARAPDALIDHARAVTNALRGARDDGHAGLAAEELDHALERLTEAASETCEPR